MHSSRKSRRLVLPRSGAKREALRVKGQFWTPDWVADFMVAYVLKEKPPKLLDPAVGEGVFFRVAKRYAEEQGFSISLHGRDVDPETLQQAKTTGLSDSDLSNVELKDFVLDPPADRFPAVIANPPYIRHHRLSVELKESLCNFARMATGRQIDGRAGFQVYFLIRALLVLAPQGRLAYIVSADICEGVFADSLWQWICSHYRLDSVVTFAAEATPFPDVDTNAIVFLISNDKPQPDFDWVKCNTRESAELISLITGGSRASYTTLEIYQRSLSEALSTGLSRPPSAHTQHHFTLGDFASVMRGIVTGDNEFFFMTLAQARELGIPGSLLVRALGRTRDVQGELLTKQDIDRLDTNGRPTWLLTINGMSLDQLPQSVQEYIREGEKRGVPDKTLIKTRNPWYRMETRRIPPIMFAYLGRRNARFIRNLADVVPLTCLLCIYPRRSSADFIERLWNVLSHPDTVKNLRMVGKSYGGDAIKVEPRALERLPLPDELVKAQGLDKLATPKQGILSLE